MELGSESATYASHTYVLSNFGICAPNFAICINQNNDVDDDQEINEIPDTNLMEDVMRVINIMQVLAVS